MAPFIQPIVRRSFAAAKGVIKNNPKLFKLLYDVRNIEDFSDLFWHEKMIADSVRVNTYARGIRHHIKPGDVVVDIGTGTGVLAILAAKSGARKIFAIDHSSMLSVAEYIARHNKIDNIMFSKINSRDFTAEEPVDVILQEQMGHALFGENMIENLLDLKRRLLKPTGRIVPGRFELFIEPCAIKEQYRVPFLWEHEIHGIDFGCMKDFPDIEKFKYTNYPYMFIHNFYVERILSDPEVAIEFDLNKIESENEIPNVIEAKRTLTRSGIVDGFCVYFRTIFDDDISFDTSPLGQQTSWRNLTFRVPRKQYKEGDTIRYTINLNTLNQSTTWTITIQD